MAKTPEERAAEKRRDQETEELAVFGRSSRVRHSSQRPLPQSNLEEVEEEEEEHSDRGVQLNKGKQPIRSLLLVKLSSLSLGTLGNSGIRITKPSTSITKPIITTNRVNIGEGGKNLLLNNFKLKGEENYIV